MKEPLLKVSNLSVKIGNDVIFENLNFELHENDRLVILGPNGAGKTVLLKALIGVLAHTGEIRWRSGMKFGYVPQRVALSKDTPMTVSDFFSLKGIDARSAAKSLREVDLADDILRAQLAHLSAGQFQRTLIAWATVFPVDILVLDEPLTALDVTGADIVHSYLHVEQRAQTKAFVLVTHDLSMVYAEATKILCINRNRHYFGTRHEVLDPKVLQEIYGREIHFVRHQHA